MSNFKEILERTSKHSDNRSWFRMFVREEEKATIKSTIAGDVMYDIKMALDPESSFNIENENIIVY